MLQGREVICVLKLHGEMRVARQSVVVIKAVTTYLTHIDLLVALGIDFPNAGNYIVLPGDRYMIIPMCQLYAENL